MAAANHRHPDSVISSTASRARRLSSRTEDDRGLRPSLVELTGQGKCLLELGPHLDAGLDLVLGDLVALRAVEGFKRHRARWKRNSPTRSECPMTR